MNTYLVMIVLASLAAIEASRSFVYPRRGAYDKNLPVVKKIRLNHKLVDIVYRPLEAVDGDREPAEVSDAVVVSGSDAPEEAADPPESADHPHCVRKFLQFLNDDDSRKPDVQLYLSEAVDEEATAEQRFFGPFHQLKPVATLPYLTDLVNNIISKHHYKFQGPQGPPGPPGPAGPPGPPGPPGVSGLTSLPPYLGTDVTKNPCTCSAGVGYCVVNAANPSPGSQTLDLSGAQSYCNSYGLNLVSIEDAAEEALILGLLSNTSIPTQPPPQFWTSGMSSATAPFVWTWTDDNTPFTNPTNWCPGYPLIETNPGVFTPPVNVFYDSARQCFGDAPDQPRATKYFVCETRPTTTCQ